MGACGQARKPAGTGRQIPAREPASRIAQSSTDRFQEDLRLEMQNCDLLLVDLEEGILRCLSYPKGTTKVQPPAYGLLFLHRDKSFKARRLPRMSASFLARDQICHGCRKIDNRPASTQEQKLACLDEVASLQAVEVHPTRQIASVELDFMNARILPLVYQH
jgi:hypothetical protein